MEEANNAAHCSVPASVTRMLSWKPIGDQANDTLIPPSTKSARGKQGAGTNTPQWRKKSFGANVISSGKARFVRSCSPPGPGRPSRGSCSGSSSGGHCVPGGLRMLAHSRDSTTLGGGGGTLTSSLRKMYSSKKLPASGAQSRLPSVQVCKSASLQRCANPLARGPGSSAKIRPTADDRTRTRDDPSSAGPRRLRGRSPRAGRRRSPERPRQPP